MLASLCSGRTLGIGFCAKVGFPNPGFDVYAEMGLLDPCSPSGSWLQFQLGARLKGKPRENSCPGLWVPPSEEP